ncbi:hypothetical protein ACP70R_014759 [Stipagrostis hirtigluma subsp. patula]
MPPPPPLLLLPVLLLAAASAADATVTQPSLATAAGAGDGGPPPPVPTPWPEQFHAVVLSNLTASGGRLQLIDLYYDWPHGRNLNVVRDQLSGEPVYNVEWANGSSYLFDAAASSCRSTWHPVGILPPDWIAGAAYLGRDAADGFDCHVWSNLFFRRYYEDVATGRPVRWNFNGAERHVMSFEAGGVPEAGSSKWQAPACCFNGGNNAGAADGADGEDSRADAMNSLVRLAGPPAAAAAASFD